MLVSATYLDQRYKSFSFISDAEEKDPLVHKAKSYIKSTAKNYASVWSGEKEQQKQSQPPSTKKTKKSFSLLAAPSQCGEIQNDSNAQKIVDEILLYD